MREVAAGNLNHLSDYVWAAGYESSIWYQSPRLWLCAPTRTMRTFRFFKVLVFICIFNQAQLHPSNCFLGFCSCCCTAYYKPQLHKTWWDAKYIDNITPTWSTVKSPPLGCWSHSRKMGISIVPYLHQCLAVGRHCRNRDFLHIASHCPWCIAWPADRCFFYHPHHTAQLSWEAWCQWLASGPEYTQQD